MSNVVESTLYHAIAVAVHRDCLKKILATFLTNHNSLLKRILTS